MAGLRARVLGVAVIGGIAFWLATARPGHLFGIDTGHIGVLAMIGCLWLSMWWLSRVPADEMAAAASPAEWEAWIGLVFLGMAIGWFLLKLPLFAVEGPISEHPGVARGGRNVVMLVIAWLVISSVLGQRWRGRAQVDERDRLIAAGACRRGRTALLVQLAILAGLLAFSPADRLQWATPVMLAHLLILAMMLAHWLELAVQAVSYWRERH